MMRGFCTLIGSRDVADEIARIQLRLGGTLVDLGWVPRSGLADGSDSNYYYGALLSPNFMLTGFDNYVPGKWFCSRNHDPGKGLYQLNETGFAKRAWWLGIGARGTDAGLKSGGMQLHSRNSMQLLGEELKELSRFVVCHAKPIGDGTRVSGGTATAVALARHFGIEVINTYTEEGLARVLKFLEKHEQRNYAELYQEVTGLVCPPKKQIA